MNILLVEDDTSTRMIISHYLRKWGFQVFEANTGNDAQIFKGETKLFIIDLNLPDINGLQLASKLVNNQKAKTSEILLMTADPNLAVEANSSGFSTITKPFDWNHFKEHVERLMAMG